MNQWTCVEWRFDGEVKELDFWLNGTLIPDLSVRQMAMPSQGACQNRNFNGIWEPPIFNSLSVGGHPSQPGPGKWWMDVFPSGTRRVGSPAPPWGGPPVECLGHPATRVQLQGLPLCDIGASPIMVAGVVSRA